jgi:hypothetical protein
MALTETLIEGTIQPDGTLVLDEKSSLPPGRVAVVLRWVPEAATKDDHFWQRMQAMWAIQPSAGIEHDRGAGLLAEVRTSREESTEHQEEIGRLQDECPGSELPIAESVAE